MRALLLTFCMPLPLTVVTAEPATAANAEISHLFLHQEKSGCDFSRNGTRHKSSNARAHPPKKDDSLPGKDLVTSAESFIDRAATESGMSGKPYLVHCGNTKAVESGPWFRKSRSNYRRARAEERPQK